MCGHCTSVHPKWTEFMKSYENSNSIIVAEMDCYIYGPICRENHSVSFYPTFAVLYKGITTHITVKRNVESFITKAKEIISNPSVYYKKNTENISKKEAQIINLKNVAHSNNNNRNNAEKCNEFSSDISIFPAYVIHIPRNGCSVVNSLQKEINSTVFYYGGENLIPEVRVYLNKTYYHSYEYDYSITFISGLISHYALAPFGSWNPFIAFIQPKPIAIFVLSSNDQMKNISFDQNRFSKDFLFFGVSETQFRGTFPEIPCSTPSLIVSSDDKYSWSIVHLNDYNANGILENVNKVSKQYTFDLKRLFIEGLNVAAVRKPKWYLSFSMILPVAISLIAFILLKKGIHKRE